MSRAGELVLERLAKRGGNWVHASELTANVATLIRLVRDGQLLCRDEPQGGSPPPHFSVRLPLKTAAAYCETLACMAAIEAAVAGARAAIAAATAATCGVREQMILAYQEVTREAVAERDREWRAWVDQRLSLNGALESDAPDRKGSPLPW